MSRVTAHCPNHERAKRLEGTAVRAVSKGWGTASGEPLDPSLLVVPLQALLHGVLGFTAGWSCARSAPDSP